jgi:hypothetical protein
VKARSNVDVRKNLRKSEPPPWLDSSDAAFLKNAKGLLAPDKADQPLAKGLRDKFAARLLTGAMQTSDRQTEYWKLVARLWAHDFWRRHLRNAGIKGEPPPPHQFPKASLPPIIQAFVGLSGRSALPWCLSTFLASTGKNSEQIVQPIVQEFTRKAIIEALGPVLRTLEIGRQYSDGLSGRIASLLSIIFSTAASSRGAKTATTARGSVTLKRIEASTVIEMLLSARATDNLVQSDNLRTALAETAWQEADDGLARALQQTPALRQAIREQTQLSPEVRNPLGAVIQAVRSSASKRQLEIEGEPGSEVEFDPAKHSQDDPRVKAAERVRLITPTVFQGRGANRRVLRAADVEPA